MSANRGRELSSRYLLADVDLSPSPSTLLFRALYTASEAARLQFASDPAPENIQVGGMSLGKLPRDNEPITFD